MKILKELWCRAWNGSHLLVQYGTGRGYLPGHKEQQAVAFYMCARCLKVEAVHHVA